MANKTSETQIAPGIIYSAVLRIPIKLDSKNWSSWSLFVQKGLTSVDKDDHLTKLPPDLITREWRIDDSGIQMALWNAMEPQILTIAQNFSTVKKMWDHLSSSFSAQESLSHAYSVVQAYGRAEQGDSTFTDHFTRFSKLRDELRAAYPPITDLQVQEERNTKMDVMTFIAGLSPKYSSARPLLLSNPSATSSVESTYHMLREMYGHDANHTDTSAMYTSTGKGVGRGSYTTHKKGIGRGNGLVCHYCKEPGHTKWDCPNRPPRSQPPPRPKARMAATGEASDPVATPAYTFSEEDYCRLHHLLNSQTPAPAPRANTANSGTFPSLTSSWVIDSGATHHMIGNPDILSSLHKVSHQPVRLVDGSTCPVLGIGSVTNSSNLNLSSILFVPKFPDSLCSVSQLTKQNNCSAKFYPTHCIFQELGTNRLIGTGFESGGLYRLTFPPRPTANTCVSKVKEDHCRLGHPSTAVMRQMRPDLPLSSFNFHCGSCQLGTPFPLAPKVFGCVAYVHDHRPTVTKLDPRAILCVFLGYSRVQKGYRCYSPSLHRYFTSADVTFHESCPYFLEPTTSVSDPFPDLDLPTTIFIPTFPMPSVPDSPVLTTSDPAPTGPPTDPPPLLFTYSRQRRNHSSQPPDSQPDHDLSSVPPPASETNLPPPTPEPIPTSNTPYDPPGAPFPDISIAFSKEPRCCTRYPIHDYVAYSHLSPESHAYTTTLDSYPIPRNVMTALAHPGWRRAMEEEIGALRSNHTWDLETLPVGKRVVGCRWVFTVKLHPDGSLHCLKARLVAKGDNTTGITELKQFLQTQFQVSDLGRLRYFLGIEVSRSPQGILLSQRKYVLDMLTECGLLGCKPVDTPMLPTKKLLPKEGDPMKDPERYRRLVGKLNYLTVTRPDISFSVSVLSQFMAEPCTSHWDAALRVLRYLKATPGLGILYSNQGHCRVGAFTEEGDGRISGFSDADWAGCPISRRSTTGYCVFVGGNLVSWKSKKQHTVSRSSAESEYRAMADVTSEMTWIRRLLIELGVVSKDLMRLYCDNQSAIYIAKNQVFHERTKHIEVDCHLIRDRQRDSHNHLFFECPYSRKVWMKLKNIGQLQNIPPNLAAGVEHLSKLPMRKSIKSIIQRLMLAAIVYFIWQERNLRLFEGRSRNDNDLCNIIKETVRLKLLGMTIKETTSSIKLSKDWGFEVVKKVKKLKVNNEKSIIGLKSTFREFLENSYAGAIWLYSYDGSMATFEGYLWKYWKLHIQGQYGQKVKDQVGMLLQKLKVGSKSSVWAL
ncbi:uncharacterized protein LOC143621587 [Bidens hawaiensis]|uniref:uncharacterized protein LOC143621587 n=1 Tax=Bidens hawaiensis TaxID=980011 RepID=UPI00404A2068